MRRVDLEALRHGVSLLDLLPPDARPRRTGKDEYRALCSFHEEKNAAMAIKLMRGGWRFNCFACGEKGSVVDYYMRTRKVNFRTAVRELSGGRFEASAFKMPRRRAPGFELSCSECAARGDIEANDIVHLMVYRAPDLGWLVEEARQLCPSCVEKRMADPYRGGQQASFRRSA